jgi:hypothetical protein
MTLTKNKKVYVSSPTAKRQRIVKAREKKLLTPQQQAFISAYTNPKSPTYGNARQSALGAGFSSNYADQILYKPQNWLMEVDRQLGDERMLKQARINLQSYQGLDITNGGDKVDPSILSIKVKNDQWLAERLDKATFSTRTENAVLVKVEHSIDEETRKRLDALL